MNKLASKVNSSQHKSKNAMKSLQANPAHSQLQIIRLNDKNISNEHKFKSKNNSREYFLWYLKCQQAA